MSDVTIPKTAMEWIQFLHRRLAAATSKDDEKKTAKALFQLISTAEFEGKDLLLTSLREQNANANVNAKPFDQYVVPALKEAKISFTLGKKPATLEQRILLFRAIASIVKRNIQIDEVMKSEKSKSLQDLFAVTLDVQDLAAWYSENKQSLTSQQTQEFLSVLIFYIFDKAKSSTCNHRVVDQILHMQRVLRETASFSVWDFVTSSI